MELEAPQAVGISSPLPTLVVDLGSARSTLDDHPDPGSPRAADL